MIPRTLVPALGPCLFFAAIVASACGWRTPALAAPSPAFVAGDRWIAAGDSITQAGAYAGYVELFQVVRRPAEPVTYVNAGVSGDSAGGALRRVDWDMLGGADGPAPTVATVMFGMNDVGRDLYAASASDDPTTPAKRLARIDGFEKNLRTLVARLRARGVRVILLTPSPYDDTSTMPGANLPGVNAGLAACGERVRALAAELDLALIDLHGPLTALAQRQQAAKPDFTAIGNDRIHPRPAGHFAMAYHILRAQHAAGPFARVNLHADAKAASSVRGAKVERLSVSDGALSFLYLADALPYPVPDAARDALAWVPFTEELNHEELRVEGLAPGDYTLAIDGKPLGVFPAAALERGLNLATLPTPQLRQAKDVLAILERRRDVIQKQRRIAAVEYGQLPNAPRPLSLATMEPLVKAWQEKLAAKPSWESKHPGEYLEWKPLEAKLAAEAAALLDEARAAARPATRKVDIRRAQTEKPKA